MTRHVSNLYRRADAGEIEPLSAFDSHHATEAQLASECLRQRIEAMFVRFEVKHRLRAGEARFLLLDTGIRL